MELETWNKATVLSSSFQSQSREPGSKYMRSETRKTLNHGEPAQGELGDIVGGIPLAPEHSAQAASLLFMWLLWLPQGPQDTHQRELSCLLCGLALYLEKCNKGGNSLGTCQKFRTFYQFFGELLQDRHRHRKLYLGWKTVLTQGKPSKNQG